MHIRGTVNMNRNELAEALIHQVAGNPDTPAESQLWYDTTANQLKYQNDAGVVPIVAGLQKFSQLVGDGAASIFTINHNLGTEQVLVQCYTLATGVTVEPTTITRDDADNVIVEFAGTPTADQYRVVIIG